MPCDWAEDVADIKNLLDEATTNYNLHLGARRMSRDRYENEDANTPDDNGPLPTGDEIVEGGSQRHQWPDGLAGDPKGGWVGEWRTKWHPKARRSAMKPSKPPLRRIPAVLLI